MTKIQNPKPVYDLEVFLVPTLLRGNVYHMGSHAGAWEPGKTFVSHLVLVFYLILE